MINVLLIVGSPRKSAAVRTAAELIRRAPREEFRFHAVVFEDAETFLESVQGDSRVEVFPLPSPGNGAFRYGKAVNKLIRRNGYSAIHTLTSDGRGTSLLIAKLLGVPIRVSQALPGGTGRHMPPSRMHRKADESRPPRFATHFVAFDPAESGPELIFDIYRDLASVSLSFDDGRGDNTKILDELLLPMGIPATLNVCTGYIDGSCPEEYLPTRKPPMSIQDVRRFAAEPNIEIAMHGDFHLNSDEDILRGRKKLLSWLDLPENALLGFASPSSGLSPERFHAPEEEILRDNMIYCRTSLRINTLAPLRILCRKAARVIRLPFLFRIAYRDTVMRRADGQFVYSVPIMKNTTVAQVKALVRSAVRRRGAVILLLHSIRENTAGDDNWSWRRDKLSCLCDSLSSLERNGKLRICTTAHQFEQLQAKERYERLRLSARSENRVPRKKVLIIIGSLVIGGAERVARDIGFFAGDCFEIHYLVFGDRVGPYETELLEAGCKVFHTDQPAEGHMRYYRFLLHLIRRERYDAVHAHTMFNSGWAMLAGKRCGVPVRIAHSHSILDVRKNLGKQLYESVMRKLILSCATHYVACGQKAGERMYGTKAFKRSGILLLNGINTASFAFNPQSRQRLRQDLGVADRFLIGHAGHLASVKNQSYLIRLMPQIIMQRPDAFLLLLGEGLDRPVLEALVRELGLSDYVSLPGNVINVNEYLSAMDVFAFPSLYEGMPLSIIEVQSNGLPCVISDRVPKDVFFSDLLTPVPLEDKEAWIQEILRTERKNPEIYADQMKEKGLDVQTFLEKIYKLYDDEN